ncbi:hypothetical protein Cpap_2312 [Ruminiclostridium papyrosolvens DSM 2782]|uniref:Uncharacterized protein n=1 Tax=Ruminiclostridium papyrosolvens DSM 2782 TaxID=588581 RepID=F1TD40_9FIRM|nr:hypothetical protein [Ruminiclostridium papyrosolvens]EGD47907.1 hypothetical protein Cpap_2312 [Ruminiclostridium papyrosolvens DSM 2782]WES34619.1 hypothetical protein P0092_01175 [Ruminiclostridium papyrosolvens DSM 2782]
MNKEFVKKIIKSEILRYEAFKEILPEDVKKKLEGFEKDAVKVMKDIALEIITENSNKKEGAERKEIKKVSVDFS